MGVFKRPDSPWYWLYLERQCQTGIKERTTIRATPENRELAQQVYEERMKELALGRYFPRPEPIPTPRRSPRWPQEQSAWCYIYFMFDGEMIKVGRANNVVKRMRSMQSSHPRELTLLATFNAHKSVEKLIHERFRACHERGEWFTPTEELTAFIERIKKGKDPIPELANHSRVFPERFASQHAVQNH